MIDKEKSSAGIFEDLSLWGLILSNLFSILMALVQGWDLYEVMWIFWAQSVVIGAINFYRILSLKEFSTENFKMNDRSVPETPAAKKQVAFFFLLHYGFFHFGYLMFIWQEMPLSEANVPKLFFLLLCATGFMSAHGISLMHNIGRDFKQRKPNIGTLMFYPYLRIVPMHFTIIFGSAMIGEGSGNMALLLFMVLKTAADAIMHVIEHKLFQKADKSQNFNISGERI